MHSLSTPSLLPILVILRSDDHRPAHLALMGLRPMVVHSVEDALKVLAERSFSAIVVDLDLPREDTLSFISAIKDHAETADLPILALGCETDTSEALAKDRGVDVVLSVHCSAPSVFADEVAQALLPHEALSQTEMLSENIDHLDLSDTLEVAMPLGTSFGMPIDTGEGVVAIELAAEYESGIYERGGEDAVTRVARPSRVRRFPKPRHHDSVELDPFSRSFAAKF